MTVRDVADTLIRLTHLGLPSLALAAGAVLVSAVLRGLTGFGFAIIAVPLLSLVMAPKFAVGMCCLLQLVFAFTEAPRAWVKAHTAPLPTLVVFALLGTPVGMIVLRVLPESLDRIAIALAAILALVVVWRAADLRHVLKALRPAPIGFFAGLLNGLASMPGPPVVMYFLSAPIAPVAARASLIVFFAATSLFATVSGVALGIVNPAVAAAALICLPLLLAGSALGAFLFHTGDARLFRNAGLVVLAAGAATAAWKGFSGFL